MIIRIFIIFNFIYSLEKGFLEMDKKELIHQQNVAPGKAGSMPPNENEIKTEGGEDPSSAADQEVKYPHTKISPNMLKMMTFK